MTREKSNRKDIYSRITNQIVSMLEKGIKPWTQPWNATHAAGPVTKPLRFNGEAYNGINILTLWASAMDQGYAAPIWMTYKQASALGGQVRKGEKGSPVVYANTITKTEIDEAPGDEEYRTIPFMKGYYVFNVDQIDGLSDHYYAFANIEPNPDEQIAHAEEFFSNIGAEILTGGNAAYYSINSDHIQMPSWDVFFFAEGYYATLAHEATHWTRHPTRLDRDLGRKQYGDAGYAKEELVAELGSAFLCADLGIKLEDRPDHAAYIGSWLKILKNDSKAIFAAAAHAQRAADYLNGLQKNGGSS